MLNGEDNDFKGKVRPPIPRRDYGEPKGQCVNFAGISVFHTAVGNKVDNQKRVVTNGDEGKKVTVVEDVTESSNSEEKSRRTGCNIC